MLITVEAVVARKGKGGPVVVSIPEHTGDSDNEQQAAAGMCF